MNKLTISISLLLIISLNTYSQELKCIDFKNGTFLSPATDQIPYSYTIIRNGNKQTEIINDPNNTLPDDIKKITYGIIEWVDECTYRLKFDETKMELSEFQKFMNDNNGTLNELLKIEDNCFYYKSTLLVNGEEIRLDGKFCAE
ncbi:hypothetical protein [Gillisia sp. CAL575]|uniref:hypothetical protein n=1 Tax=Gillisia sp. CAL575 TaxID=985255 RepID=UPI000554F14C|nr:hypothetical protein [Gillisia sp. CAL575]